MKSAGTRRTGTNAFAVNNAPTRLTAKKAHATVGAPRNIAAPLYALRRTKRLRRGCGFSIASRSRVACMIDVISS